MPIDRIAVAFSSGLAALCDASAARSGYRPFKEFSTLRRVHCGLQRELCQPFDAYLALHEYDSTLKSLFAFKRTDKMTERIVLFSSHGTMGIAHWALSRYTTASCIYRLGSSRSTKILRGSYKPHYEACMIGLFRILDTPQGML